MGIAVLCKACRWNCSGFSKNFPGQAELIPHSQMLSPLYDLDTWTAHVTSGTRAP